MLLANFAESELRASRTLISLILHRSVGAEIQTWQNGSRLPRTFSYGLIQN